jgi:hypothetical protein
VLAWVTQTGEWGLWEYGPILPEPGGGTDTTPIRLEIDRWLAARDPLSKVISASLYATIKKPRPPVSRVRKDVASLVRRLSAAERRSVASGVKALKGYLDAIEGQLGKR